MVRKYVPSHDGISDIDTNPPPYQWLLVHDWTTWERWFAWRPVRVEGRLTWWRYIEYRTRKWRWPWGINFDGLIGENREDVEYRLIKDV